MRKTSYEYILFYLQLTLSGVFLLIFFVFNVTIEETDFFRRGMVSQNAIGFELIPREENLGASFNFLEDGTVLFQDIVDGLGLIVRGYYGAVDVFGFGGQIQEGRFFTQEDFSSHAPVAVIGSKLMPDIILENGVQYIGWNSQRFEVVGIFETTETHLDNSLYLNLGFLLNNSFIAGSYFLDGTDPEAIYQSFYVLADNLNESYFIIPHEFREHWDYVLNPGNELLLYLVMIAVQSNLIITTIFYIARKKYKVAIQKMCGMTSMELLIEHGKPILGICFLAFVTTVLVRTLSQNSSIYELALPSLQMGHYLYTAGAIGVIGIAILYFVVASAWDVNISKTLKGR